MGRTLEEVRAENPPQDQETYDQAYTEATLAFELAQLAYNMRQSAGLSQTALARRMGTTQSAIARLESGGVLPRLDLLDRLSRATGIPLSLTAGPDTVDLGMERPEHLTAV